MGYREIPLTQGKVALVDEKDFAALNRFRWRAYPARHTWYACRSTRGSRSDKRRTIQMHREIFRAAGDRSVDHINGDGLDNRSRNLRIADACEQQRNRHHIRDSTSKYKGVCWDSGRGLWRATIGLGSRQRYLGRFSDEVAAAVAYDHAARKHFGEFARPNFEPDGMAR